MLRNARPAVFIVIIGVALTSRLLASPYEKSDFESMLRNRTGNHTTRGVRVPPQNLAAPITIDLEVVATGLISPVALTHAGDGSGRLFIADQAGLIRVVENGVLLPTPFLDISAKLPMLGAIFDERGLLGIAFHPDYENNGRFFVRHSAPRVGDPNESCSDPMGFVPGCHEEILAEYAVSGDPNVADPNSEIILFRVDEPEFNHNSGPIAFGPDGYLYFTLGDGGGANDGLNLPTLPHGPIGNGQNIDVPLGKMLRIDVDAPPQAPLAYAIPPDNPFAGAPGLDEIYAYGFRNPFGFSWDDGPGGDGTLYLVDVGQDLFEEMNIIVNGGNYGWVIKEGFHCFDPFNTGNPPAMCNDAGMIDPVLEYTHVDNGLAIIGGYVYRGSVSPSLFGKILFGDFSANFGPTGRLYYSDTVGPDAFQLQEFQIAPNNDPFGQFLKGMGKDEDGELYYLASDELAPAGDTGIVYRVLGEPVGACCVGGSCSEIRLGECADVNGEYTGNNTTCLGDSDGDGADSRCEGCPDDPAKTMPGICGCGVSDQADADGDTVPDCNDQCPGIDDSLDQDNNGVADCAEAIPAASEWGIIVLALLLMVGAKLMHRQVRFN